MIEVKVYRKIKSYTRTKLGIGLLASWTIVLECGHEITRTTENLQSRHFLSEYQCADCESMATRDLERFHVHVSKEG